MRPAQRIAIAAALLLTAPAARAEEAAGAPDLAVAGIPVTGRVFTDVYLPARDPRAEEFRQVSTSLWLQGEPKLGENTFGRFVLAADSIESRDVTTYAGSEFRVGIREAYVGYSRPGLEIRAGKQILPWGASDAINPTDFISAKDYTFFNPDEEVRRIGATNAWINWTPRAGDAPYGFTLVAQPVFPQSRLLIPPTAAPAGVALQAAPVTPSQTIENTELALKASYFGSSWDASLLAFRGFSHLPEFELVGLAGTPPAVTATIARSFHRIRAAGAEGSFTAGAWVFRGETAYVWTQNDDGSNPLIQPSRLDTVIGAERPLGDRFRLQIQGIHRYIPAFVEPDSISSSDPARAAIYPELARANALLLGYQFKSRPGATFRLVHATEEDGHETEIFVVGNFVGGDYLVRPQHSHRWTESLRTTIGLQLYGGPENRPLGALRSFNSLYAEGKYSF